MEVKMYAPFSEIRIPVQLRLATSMLVFRLQAKIKHNEAVQRIVLSGYCSRGFHMVSRRPHIMFYWLVDELGIPSGSPCAI